MSTDVRKLMLADLARSGLDKGDAEAMRLKPHSSAETREITGGRVAAPSYEIPYRDESGNVIEFSRHRFLGDVRKFGDNKSQRYWQPPNSAPQAYLPTNPKVCSQIFKDAKTPVLVLEGEKKAQLANKVGDTTAIALGGVYNFGSKKLGIELIPLLRELAASKREIFIAFDGGPNSDVTRASDVLAHRMAAEGACVWLVQTPQGQQVDDFILKEGWDAFVKLPRRPFDPKRQIAVTRSLPKVDLRTKRDRISEIVRGDMNARGTFHEAAGEPLYFDRQEVRLYTLVDHRDPQLRAFVNDVYGLNAAETEAQFVHQDMQAHALRRGERTTVHRFAYYDRAAARLHIHLAARQTFRITADACERVCNGSDGVLFRESAAEPIEHVRSAGAAAFRFVTHLPNFRGTSCLPASHQQLIYDLWVWSLFFLRTGPILVVDAPKGAGKTTGARALGLSLFGAQFDVFVAERERLDDFATVLTNSDLVVADNLDGKYPGFENLLCLAATGGQVPRRKLFTTNDQINYAITARVMTTTREPIVFTRDDLRDRAVFLRLERREDFEPEQEILKRVMDGRPKFWAYALATLPAIVRALSEPPIRTKHRLADFAAFCLAAGPALGYSRDEVAAALDGIEAERTAFAEDHCPVLRVLQTWIEWQRSFASKCEDGEPAVLGCKNLPTGALFEQVQSTWSQGRFPFSSLQSFGLAIKNEEPLLQQHFDIERRNTRSRQTLITIRPRKEQS